MPSKGVKCFAYIAVGGIEIEFSVPKQSVKRNSPHQFTTDHLEVDLKNLGRFKFAGNFAFVVRRDGRELTKQSVNVNVLTGRLESGTMITMDQTPSVLVEDVIICYGFYDAGPGVAELPKQHQCYVTVTKNSHDIGMNSMQTSLELLKNAGTGIIKEILGKSLPAPLEVLNKVSNGAINRIAPNIIRALAVTQKDTLATILKIGARYFEFRPAKCHREIQKVSPLADTWYFQHGAIPGMSYKQFLSDIIQFLQDHSDEIVVVQNRWDGVPQDCPKPNDDDLRNILNDVLKDKEIQVGNQDDMMRKSIRDLRAEKKRLIVLRDVNQVSNYDDAANATLTGDSMVVKLNDMSQHPPQGHPITLLQCQATATNIRDVIVASVLDSDVSTSPILATKPVCDSKILPLLSGDTGKNLVKEESVVVLLNDFFDGATADVAINLCRDRLG
ncbi:hypothetical protein P153DRAFT_338519 [Dothidotthia symphoricarpi CBS 119687]|uniref:PLC-like phosphodiesterase n=1 Tax=Dothidotthia symphoricarpi CBS 119687 TaxID=1392245 RepID=A0A6A6AJG7_9PLEO|nr:uncharacterized protein P153DRAFT_338519 [Dothidotthia symphoricarpi CBS 119687]KAF2130581.1 hypothetical protein P153DRAFT_338519 [Dothidotthia symphoricarpi CBS 119687]